MSTPELLYLGIEGPIERARIIPTDRRFAPIGRAPRDKMRAHRLIVATPAQLATARRHAFTHQSQKYLTLRELWHIGAHFNSRLYTAPGFRGYRADLLPVPGYERVMMLPLGKALALMRGTPSYPKNH